MTFGDPGESRHTVEPEVDTACHGLSLCRDPAHGPYLRPY